MRIKYAFVVLLIALVGTPATPLTGQEEPLPTVTSRTAPYATGAPSVYLAVEPVRQLHQPTLLEAARNNDYVTFDALYREAASRGDAAQYETLHELWTYAVTDPVGAFYGRDMYERFARAYPGFPGYIDAHRIVDSRGNSYWPTGETRAYLLDRIREGSTPRVLIAEARPSVRSFESDRDRSSASEAIAPPTRTSSRRRFIKAEAKPAAITPDALPAKQPAAAAPVTQLASATPVSAPVPAPAAAATTTPIEEPAPVTASVEPVQASAMAQVAPVQASAVTPQSAASRGVLLLAIGLAGIALLAVMLRTPRETVPATIIPKAEEKPAPTVAPLKRPEAQKETKTHRANGSRG